MLMPEKQPNTPMDRNPIAQFNLNITGNNPDFQPKPGVETDLKPAEKLIPSPELQAELKDSMLITDPETGQSFEVLHLNREAEDDPLIMTLAWSINTQHEGTNYEAEQTAIQTGRPMWVINNPNTSALGDKLSKEQREDLKHGNGFEALANPLLSALKAQGINRASLEGTSMGARIAASLAANASRHGIEIDSLILIDPPGMTDRSLTRLTKDFVGENPNLMRYNELSHDPRYTENDTIMDTIKFFASLARQGFDTNFLSYTRAMAKGNLADDMMMALGSQERLRITLIYGTESRISSPEAIMNLYRQQLSQVMRQRIRLELLPGETHALGQRQAKKIAAHIDDALK